MWKLPAAILAILAVLALLAFIIMPPNCGPTPKVHVRHLAMDGLSKMEWGPYEEETLSIEGRDFGCMLLAYPGENGIRLRWQFLIPVPASLVISSIQLLPVDAVGNETGDALDLAGLDGDDFPIPPFEPPLSQKEIPSPRSVYTVFRGTDSRCYLLKFVLRHSSGETEYEMCFCKNGWL